MTDTERKEEYRQVLYKVIRNSTLWDACVLEAYEGDVQELIENILFARFTKRPQDNNALVPLDRDKLAKILAQHRGGHSGFPPASWDYDLADVICAKFGKDNNYQELIDQIKDLQNPESKTAYAKGWWDGIEKYKKDNNGMVPRAGLLTEDKADQVAREVQQ
jgi:hypothetical protein